MTSRLMSVDTSVAIPLLVERHASHRWVASWARGRKLGLSAHALAETYSVLTRLPGGNRLLPADAVELIDGNFPERLVLPVELSSNIHRELAQLGIAGGAAYDGMVALVAKVNEIPLATRDARARSTYLAVGVEIDSVAEGVGD